MKIDCIKYRPINCGAFSGFADLYIEDLDIEVFGCTLYEKNDMRWLNLPVRTYVNKEGEEKYSHIIKFRSPSRFREFCTIAKASIDEYVKMTEEKSEL